MLHLGSRVSEIKTQRGRKSELIFVFIFHVSSLLHLIFSHLHLILSPFLYLPLCFHIFLIFFPPFSSRAFFSASSFCFSSVQIIQDRVDSHVSRNRLLWNSLPGGLYALPQYSTDPAQFPFYYAILGKCQIRSLA